MRGCIYTQPTISESMTEEIRVYYGLQTDITEEKSLLECLCGGFDLALIPINAAMKLQNSDVAKNCVVEVTSEAGGFWENVQRAIQSSACKYFCIDILEDVYNMPAADVKRYINNLLTVIGPEKKISLQLALEGGRNDWHYWKNIQCDGLGVILNLRGVVGEYEVSRWQVEPVVGVIISEKIMESNDPRPILYMREVVGKLVSRRPPPAIFLSAKKESAFLLMKHLKQFAGSAKVEPYDDVLIEPLQPLRDNLDISVYEIFEEDSVKYRQYEHAMLEAISDIPKSQISVLVIGPGRGPLIERLLSVSRGNSREILVDAVEKNPKCLEILKHKNETMWSYNVNIYYKDARSCTKRNYDIIVSELIGSFGCNELAPEILSSFKRKNTIMIPESITNYVRPIYSKAICNLSGKQLQRPYLIKLLEFYPVSRFAQAWKFLFPDTESVDTSRYHEVHFHANHASHINGFEGVFCATLYKRIMIGIHPTLRVGCCKSWFPMIFPVKEAIVPLGLNFKFCIQRSIKEHVWYEWSFDDRVYNINGYAFRIEL